MTGRGSVGATDADVAAVADTRGASSDPGVGVEDENFAIEVSSRDFSLRECFC